MLTRRMAIAALAAGLGRQALAGQSAPLAATPGAAATPPEAAPDLVDLAYSDRSPRNLLDLRRPPGSGPCPVFLDIHGGGFLTGDKRQLRAPAAVVAQGIAVARMNYRLSDQARWPAQQEDVLTAIDWLRAHATGLGLRADRIAVGGHSAGAFLALSAALRLVAAGRPPAAVVDFYGPTDFGSMDNDMARLGLPVSRRPADSPRSVESLLVGYAVGERRDAARAMGPVGQLARMDPGTDLPALMIRHGTADRIVAVGQAERLRSAWAEVDPGAEIDIALLAGEGHGTAGFAAPATRQALAAFLARHLL